MTPRIEIRRPGVAPERVPLVPGNRYVLGRDPRPTEGDHGIVIDDDRISRQHLSLDVRDDEVRVTDLNSRNGTRVRGMGITSVRAVAQPVILSVGRLEVLVVPPEAGVSTKNVRSLRVKPPMLRVKLVTLCRDHVVPPYRRGAWVLRAKDLFEILSVNGSPNESTLTKDIAQVKGLAGIGGATTEELIDWAVASGEVTSADAVALDEYLLRERGATYDELVLRTTRAATLRYMLQKTAD